MRNPLHALLCFLAFLWSGFLVPACTGDSGVTLLVRSNLRVPDDVDEIRIDLDAAGSTGGRYESSKSFLLTGDEAFHFPVRVSVGRGSMLDVWVEFHVTGYKWGTPVIDRWAHGYFRDNEVREVAIDLTDACLYATRECAPGLQCVDGECVPIDHPPEPGTDGGTGTGCERLPEGASCDDGIFCNGIDRCNASHACTHAGDPCDVPAETCDEGTRACLPAGDYCPTGSNEGDPCDDGLFCNGQSTCDADLMCVEGEPPCPDACTFGCTEASRRCSVNQDNCLIDGTCYDLWNRNPDRACEYCGDFSHPRDAWSEWNLCDAADTDACTLGYCDAGSCTPEGTGGWCGESPVELAEGRLRFCLTDDQCVNAFGVSCTAVYLVDSWSGRDWSDLTVPMSACTDDSSNDFFAVEVDAPATLDGDWAACYAFLADTGSGPVNQIADPLNANASASCTAPASQLLRGVLANRP